MKVSGGVYIGECVYFQDHILQNVYKKASWFHHAQGAGGERYLFLVQDKLRGFFLTHSSKQRYRFLPL